MQRSGIGYDIHRLVADRKLILGGIEIPSALGLLGHSDADVLSHAIADALLGAVAENDIGHHFPNTDASIEGISSLEILARVAGILREKYQARIINVDSTLIAEAPKIGPHLSDMRKAIAAALGLSEDRVGIKATTHEMLGSIGRNEGMAAMATASIEVPDLD